MLEKYNPFMAGVINSFSQKKTLSNREIKQRFEIKLLSRS